MKRKHSIIAFVAVVALAIPLFLTRSFVPPRAQEKESVLMPDFEGAVNAPDFPPAADWLNTSRPISLRDLRGKVVLLDFWTFCCINCMHVIPDLKKLEAKYPNELVVIGVHSAKFTTERETENIREAILRYELHHPVVNDKDMRIWRSYSVHSWPSLVLIDPTGKLIGGHSGEGIYELFDLAISKTIESFDKRGLIDRKPVRFDLEAARTPQSVLSFPGKVLADAPGKRLFIADSNHNRIVVAALIDGRVLDVIGEGEIGLRDGGFETSQFNHPQGMSFRGDTLFVADTENHAIRAADLKARSVSTIAGTGEQARGFLESGTGRKLALNSPWDLVAVGDTLYIAMAGPHQLWKMDLKTSALERYAGSGQEGRQDGALRFAALAQPSGITTDGKRLYFADSEVSSIRSADLTAEGGVETIVGLDLFEYGDVDGVGDTVRLQHPLGVTYDGGILYVADTYNNKIKRIHPAARAAQTFAGTGQSGFRDGKDALLNEPGGVSVADGKLYVADTNNHVIRVVDLKSALVSTFEFRGIERLTRKITAPAYAEQAVTLQPAQVAPGHGTLTIRVGLPNGHKFSPNAPARIEMSAGASAAVQFAGNARSLAIDKPAFPATIPVSLTAGEGEVTAELTIYYCREGAEGLCFFKSAFLKLPVVVKQGGNSHLEISYRVGE